MDAMFMDLSAAFDNIGRKKLWEILGKKGIHKEMLNTLKRLYEDTKTTIRTKDDLTKEIETKKGIKQGYVLSPMLFNLHTADLDLYLTVKEIGGIKLGKDKMVFSVHG